MSASTRCCQCSWIPKSWMCPKERPVALCTAVGALRGGGRLVHDGTSSPAPCLRDARCTCSLPPSPRSLARRASRAGCGAKSAETHLSRGGWWSRSHPRHLPELRGPAERIEQSRRIHCAVQRQRYNRREGRADAGAYAVGRARRGVWDGRPAREQARSCQPRHVPAHLRARVRPAACVACAPRRTCRACTAAGVRGRRG